MILRRSCFVGIINRKVFIALAQIYFAMIPMVCLKIKVPICAVSFSEMRVFQAVNLFVCPAILAARYSCSQYCSKVHHVKECADHWARFTSQESSIRLTCHSNTCACFRWISSWRPVNGRFIIHQIFMFSAGLCDCSYSFVSEERLPEIRWKISTNTERDRLWLTPEVRLCNLYRELAGVFVWIIPRICAILPKKNTGYGGCADCGNRSMMASVVGTKLGQPHQNTLRNMFTSIRSKNSAKRCNAIECISYTCHPARPYSKPIWTLQRCKIIHWINSKFL